MFLTQKELTALIGPCRKATMRKWLDQENIPYIIGMDGWPRVSRALIAARLGESYLEQKPNRPRLHLG